MTCASVSIWQQSAISEVRYPQRDMQVLQAAAALHTRMMISITAFLLMPALRHPCLMDADRADTQFLPLGSPDRI